MLLLACSALINASCQRRAASHACQRAALDFLGSTGPSRTQRCKQLREASEACKEERRLNDHSFGASFLTRSCLSYSSSNRWGRVPNITEEAAPTRPRREPEGLEAAKDRGQYFH